MKVTLGSMFRDSVPYIGRYFDQIKALRREVDVRLVIAEGDSQDSTYGMLLPKLDVQDTLIQVEHGGRRYGSINEPARWRNIARVFTSIIGTVADPGDVFLWVESDLIWDAATMLQLVEDTATHAAVAPLVLCSSPRPTRYYDVYGFRKDGVKFRSWPPYWNIPTGDRFEHIDSCGSCFAVAPEAWGSVVEWDGMWPFTANGQLWLDTTLTIRHP